MAEYVIRGETLTEIADAIREKKGMIAASEYTQLEYIESTGTQYIDTGYAPTSENLKIVTRFTLMEIQAWHALFGCEGTTSGPWALTPLVNLNSALVFYSGTSSQVGSIPVTANTVYSLTCQANNGVITYECGETTGTVNAEGSLCKTDSLYVFTINSAKEDGVISQASKMRVYSFQIYDNDVLVRDFVPCVHASGTAGLYDLTNDVFHANAGSGAFNTGAEIGAIGGTVGGDVSPIPTTSMAEEILALETGRAPDLQTKTVTPSASKQTVTPDSGYDGLAQVTVNAIPAAEQATPSITVSAAGLITASATQAAGYVPTGTKTATKQLTVQAAQTITPGTSSKTIAAGRYLTGAQTIQGDSNLVPENIKSGVSIFGVTGTCEGGTVQRKRGAFAADANGQATVSCGFRPDCVAVYGGIFGGETVYAGAMFAEASEDTINVVVAPPNTEYIFTILTITRTNDGFTVYAEKTAGSYFQSPETDRVYNYTALKYT